MTETTTFDYNVQGRTATITTVKAGQTTEIAYRLPVVGRSILQGMTRSVFGPIGHLMQSSPVMSISGRLLGDFSQLEQWVESTYGVRVVMSNAYRFRTAVDSAGKTRQIAGTRAGCTAVAEVLETG